MLDFAAENDIPRMIEKMSFWQEQVFYVFTSFGFPDGYSAYKALSLRCQNQQDAKKVLNTLTQIRRRQKKASL